MKILTNQKQAPWLWVVIIGYPWFAIIIRESISTTGITFTLKKFTDDPSLIGLIGSSNQAFGLFIGSFCAFTSDHIWTRFGRRRPFLIIAAFASAFVCLFIPIAGDIWLAVSIIIVYQMVVDIGAPYEPLCMEVIPSHQRGRAGAINHVFKAVAFTLVFAGLIGGFDRIYRITGNLVITGEQIMYWMNAAIILVAGSIFLFLVKEEKPEGAESRRLREVPYKSILKELVSPEILPLLGLVFVLNNLWLGIGQFESLLVTEQWAYSKSDYGNIMSMSMILTVALVPIGGWLSDRFDRLRLLKYGLAITILLKMGYYVYAEYLAPGGIPPYHMVLGLGLFKGAIGSFLGVACVPLLFEFISRNRLGTLACGMGITYGLVTLLGTNVMGQWIKFSSPRLYGLPENTYNYMAAYHWIFLLGVLGVSYMIYFEYLVKTGKIKKVPVVE